MCFQQLLRSQKNALISSTVTVKKTSAPLWIVAWGLSHSIIRGNIDQKLLSLWKQLLFRKVCFYQPLRFAKECSYHLHKNCQKTLWTVIYCSLSFVILDNMRKRVKYFFSIGKVAFYQNFVFSTISQVLNKAPISSGVNFKTPCEPLSIVSWGLSHSMTRGKMGEKLLSSWKQLLLGKLVSIDLLHRNGLVICTIFVNIHCGSL